MQVMIADWYRLMISVIDFISICIAQVIFLSELRKIVVARDDFNGEVAE